jgi:hypothetical protein
VKTKAKGKSENQGKVNPSGPIAYSPGFFSPTGLPLLPFVFCLGFHLFITPTAAAECVPLARLKYGGGGDWYSGPSMLPNLAKRLQADLGFDACKAEKVVDPLAADLYETPVLFLTGHGRVENFCRYYWYPFLSFFSHFI